MNIQPARLLKIEFEARIFVSLGIVALVCGLAFLGPWEFRPNVVAIGSILGVSPETSLTAGYALVALILAGASVLRMWSGSVLTSKRVMAFRVQSDLLVVRGPYRIVRNPIYLADFIAVCAVVFVLPPVGLIMPLLFYAHYIRLIRYEEVYFAVNFSEQFARYRSGVPKLLPTPQSLKFLTGAIREFEISMDGIRHNALYVLFIAGFLVAIWTRELAHAILIGLPGLIDWAVVHTIIGVRKKSGTAEARPNRSRKKVFNDILYSQCWEDPAIDRAAFRIRPDDVVFSITSGGCNVLTFLLDDPRKVIALDFNPYQNYLLELKIAAFKTLSYDEVLEFIGVHESDRRSMLYRRMRGALRDESRGYWDMQQQKIARGVLHCGRYERYMGLLRTWIHLFIGRKFIESFFTTDSPERRSMLFHTKWENIWWRLLTRVLLSRRTMSVLFDKAFFEFLDDSFSFGEHFAARAERALTILPCRKNYFLSYILFGRFYDENCLPHYLRRENFSTIRDRLDRIMVVTDSCERFFATLPDHTISKFNFTNIFEWMSPAAFEALLRDTIRVARDGAVLTYRNLLVFREHPGSLERSIHSHREAARELHNRDLSFIYKNYVVETIERKEHQWDSRLKSSAIAVQ